MEKLKQVYKKNLLNEDAIYKSIIMKTTKRSSFQFLNTKLATSLGVLAIIILAIIISNIPSLYPDKTLSIVGVTTPSNKLAYAIVSVDINPSFELYIDLDDAVIEINALNEDAKSLSVAPLIGLPVQDVVEELIKQAQDAGLIDLSDTTQATVIISTISYGLDGTKLVKDIQVKLRSSLSIDRSIKSYIIKATDKDREEAKRENVSIGIYMLNGLIHNNGIPMSVQTFVSDLNNLEILEATAENTSGTELVAVIQVLIDELNRLNVNTSNFQKRLNTEGEDLEELIEDLKDTFESFGYSDTSNTHDDDDNNDEKENDD